MVGRHRITTIHNSVQKRENRKHSCPFQFWTPAGHRFSTPWLVLRPVNYSPWFLAPSSGLLHPTLVLPFAWKKAYSIFSWARFSDGLLKDLFISHCPSPSGQASVSWIFSKIFVVFCKSSWVSLLLSSL